jgi:HSP20 family protein
VPLPAPAETAKVTASLSDGVLTVTVPRSEDEKPHRVEVTSSWRVFRDEPAESRAISLAARGQQPRQDRQVPDY